MNKVNSTIKPPINALLEGSSFIISHPAITPKTAPKGINIPTSVAGIYLPELVIRLKDKKPLLP